MPVTELPYFSGPYFQNRPSGRSLQKADLLIANSSDTVFALGPLFAESDASARTGLIAGFILAATLWLALVLGVSSRLARSKQLARIAPRIAPWMMILIGLYILSDSATDLV